MKLKKKEKEIWKLVKQAFKIGGIVGASAVIGYLLRGQDLSGMKGLGKLLAGLGIIGLASAAGEAAGESLVHKVDGAEEVAEFLLEVKEKYSEDEDDDTVADPT